MSTATMIAPKNYTATMNGRKNYRAGNKHYDQPREATQKTSAYCKVCHDAGRPRREYTSHFVKDKKGPDGKVVCPLLLNQECRFCHEKGHTPKQCPAIKAKEQRKRDYEKRQREFMSRPDSDGFRAVCSHRHTGPCRHQALKTRRAAQEALTSQLKPINMFAALQEASSDEESKTKTVVEEFPTLTSQLSPKVLIPSEPRLTGWAALAAKPAAQPKPEVQVQMPPAFCPPPPLLTNEHIAQAAEATPEVDEWEKQLDGFWRDDEAQGGRAVTCAVADQSAAPLRDEWGDEEFKQMKGASWADLCDSDNEEEEEED